MDKSKTFGDKRAVAADERAGRCCWGCHTYYVGEHGGMTLCRWCWRKLSPAARAGCIRATLKEQTNA